MSRNDNITVFMWLVTQVFSFFAGEYPYCTKICGCILHVVSKLCRIYSVYKGTIIKLKINYYPKRNGEYLMKETLAKLDISKLAEGLLIN